MGNITSGDGALAGIAQTNHVSGNRLTLATLCVAVLIAQIDTSIVNLAIRPIGRYFAAGVDMLQWVLDSYNLVYAALLLTGGVLADLYGRRRIFVAGTFIFTLSSVLCMCSPTVTVLTGARAVAGLGAALMLPASLAIIRVAWTDSGERRKVLGIWAGCNGLALAFGPTLGGLLISYFGWRSIFLLVIPLGIAALTLAPLTIPESSDRQGRHFDASGQILGAAALGCFAIAGIELRHHPVIAAVAFGMAVVILSLFIRVEGKRGSAALVHLDMFATRPFRGAMAATAGMTFGMYGVLFLVPMTWQSENIFGPFGAGVALVPTALLFVLTSPFSGRLTAIFGARAITVGGVVTIGVGLLVIGLTAHAHTIVTGEIGLCMTGVGMGLATGPLMGTAVDAVPRARAGTAASLINAARMVGATLGVAVLGTVFAAAKGGAHGLCLSMLTGGGVQIASAGIAWRTTRYD